MTFYPNYNLNIPNYAGTLSAAGMNFGTGFDMNFGLNFNTCFAPNFSIPWSGMNFGGFGSFGNPGLFGNSDNFGGFGGLTGGFGTNFDTYTSASTPSYTPFTTPSFTQSAFGTSTPSTTKEETYEEYQARKAKELEKKAKEREKERAEKEQRDREKPLTKQEADALRKESLELDKKSNKKESQHVDPLAFAMPALSTVPLIKKGAQAKGTEKTIEMFYKTKDKKYLALFSDNPELMTNAQETMQKLERKFARDIKAAKDNTALIEQEQDKLRKIMESALNTKSEEKIAKATARCQAAAGVKNGWLRRGLREKQKIASRYDAALSKDVVKNVKVPPSGKSFWKNMFSNKLSILMSLIFVATPFITNWGNIKQAKAIDKENKENGKITHHGRKQITQTSIESAAGFLCFNVADTAVRTVAKRALGKFAAKFAAKLIAKGGCKALGAIIGSVAPGIGNLLGLIVGTVLDIVLTKYVFGKMEFFNNSGVKEAQVETATDEELLSSISEQYMQGEKISDNAVRVLQRKYDKETFGELKRIHNMPEKKRNEYLAQLQQQQQEAVEQTIPQLNKVF